MDPVFRHRLGPAPLAGLLAVAALAAAAACADPVEPARERVMGALLHYHDPPLVFLPDSVDAGQEFEVRINTYSRGECTERHSVDVEVAGLTAAITPWHDRVLRPDCDRGRDMMLGFPVFLTFHQPGDATITIHGRHRPRDEPVSLHYQVVVR
jgi:hypothetical protein